MIKGILLAILLSATAWAQTGSTNNTASVTNPATTNAATRLAPGSVIPVELTKSIDAKKVKAGEKVVAKVSQDLKSNSGEVILPKDTQVIGRVTEAQARNKQQPESELGIAFDRAVEKDGAEMQMPMSIQAIIGQQNNAAQQGASTAQPEQSSAGEPGMGNMQRPGTEGGSTAAPTGNMSPSTPSAAPVQRPRITAQTQGVVGIPNLQLQQATQNTQGSLVTSDKKNVKLDSGTMMLLKVQ